jgi:hypothetical protein
VSAAALGAGRHSARDGSYRRSVLWAAGRAVLLVAAAVAIGILILQATDTNPRPTRATAATSSTTTRSRVGVRPAASTTTSTVAPLRKPSQVRVLSLNGSGRNGEAAKMSDRVKALGYQIVSPPGTATAVQKQTIVYFRAGFEREANVLGAGLGPNIPVRALPTPPPGPGTEKADLVVVVGSG